MECISSTILNKNQLNIYIYSSTTTTPFLYDLLNLHKLEWYPERPVVSSSFYYEDIYT